MNGWAGRPLFRERVGGELFVGLVAGADGRVLHGMCYLVNKESAVGG